MPITAFDGLTPPSTDDPTNFDTRADAWMAAFLDFQTQANALESDLNNLVAAAYTTSSATSLAIGTGTKSFTVQTGLGFIAGQSGVMSSAADPSNRMIFTVTSYDKTSGAMVVNVATVNGSGTYADWVVGLTPTGFAAGQTPGTATNDNALAGNVGEYVSSTVLSNDDVSLSNDVAANITSISLTAGDWDVWGTVGFNVSGVTAIGYQTGWISQVSATNPSAPNNGAYVQAYQPASGGLNVLPVGMQRISTTTTTLVYLSVISGWTSGTSSAYGFIGARRVR